ncbi:hypothetical protein [Legionella genomosp. 1]|uniref:hypothetical protein n=1 Tax=Legionella genomosp. 1 TaxID=1093625 RepID=UPI0010553680|nr:hypothetical protein [Legionella genomosp. 1]
MKSKKELRQQYKTVLKQAKALKNGMQYTKAAQLCDTILSNPKVLNTFPKIATSATKIKEESTSLEIRKAIVMRNIGRFAEAIQVLEQLNQTTVLSPDTAQKILQLQEETFAEANLKIKGIFTSKETIDQTIPPTVLCKESYLAEKNEIFAQHSLKMKESFSARVDWVLRLIQFLKQHMLKANDTFPFIKEEFLQQNAAGAQKRFSFMGNITLPYFSGYRNGISILMQRMCDRAFRNAANDYYLEDSVDILRMLFETIYRFPRNERGLLTKYLPWGEHSWYLLDFFSAIFATTDLCFINDGFENGLSIAPFNFDGDIVKQKQLIQFHSVMLTFRALVKHSVTDILTKDLEGLSVFFEQVKNHLSSGTPLIPMEKPENLETLLRFSKHSFLLLKLIALLPRNYAKSTYSLEVIQETGVSLDTIESVDKQKLCEWLANKSEPITPIDKFLPADNKTPEPEAEKVHPIWSQSLLESTQKATKGQQLTLCAIKDSNQLAPHTRFQILGFDDFKSIKNRLSLLRVLEMTGEFFMPRNWGNKQKTLDIIDIDMVGKIRSALSHPEEREYLSVIKDLEKDPVLLEQLHNELMIFSGSVYELVVSRESELDWQVEDTSSGYDDWKDAMDLYWQSIKKHYSLDKKTSPHILAKPLLEEKERDTLLGLVLPAHHEMLKGCLANDVSFFFDHKKSPLNLFDEITANLSSTDKKQNADKRQVKKLLTKADKSYRAYKSDFETKKRKEDTLNNQRIKQNQADAMTNFYPGILQVAQTFWKAQTNDSNDLSEILEKLIDRLDLLTALLEEENLDDDSLREFQELLHTRIKDDIRFSQSIAYLLGQIISCINKLSSLCDLSLINQTLHDKLGDLISLRNALEHSDPFVESSVTSFYNMFSPLTQLMACTVGEIVFYFNPDIKDFQTRLKIQFPDMDFEGLTSASSSFSGSTSSLPSLISPTGLRVKQENALRLSGFVFAQEEVRKSPSPEGMDDFFQAEDDLVLMNLNEELEKEEKEQPPVSLTRSGSEFYRMRFFERECTSPTAVYADDAEYQADSDAEFDIFQTSERPR